MNSDINNDGDRDSDSDTVINSDSDNGNENDNETSCRPTVDFFLGGGGNQKQNCNLEIPPPAHPSLQFLSVTLILFKKDFVNMTRQGSMNIRGNYLALTLPHSKGIYLAKINDFT